MKFKMYRRLLSRQWRWRLVARNGEPIASGEGYHNKADCRAAIELVKGSIDAPVVEESR